MRDCALQIANCGAKGFNLRRKQHRITAGYFCHWVRLRPRKIIGGPKLSMILSTVLYFGFLNITFVETKTTPTQIILKF